jgi:broad specificity phosphatase PhoE
MVPFNRSFYFLRHGEADWNLARRCIGRQDRPLTDHGRAQAADARGLCARLPISVVFHSPLLRAAETAAIITGDTDWPLVEASALREACLGIKEGAAEDDPSDRFIEHWYGGAVIAGAETFQALGGRIVRAVQDCLDAAPELGVPLIVGHSASYRALREAMGQPVDEVLHCTPYSHRLAGGDWRIEPLPTWPSEVRQ